MGTQMVKTKLLPTVDCPCCGHPNKDTGHILQCPHLDVQLLWDLTILQLWSHLSNNETKPSLIGDLSAGINAWRKQEPQPLAITLVGQAQGPPHLAESCTQLPLDRLENTTGHLLQQLTKPILGHYMGSRTPQTYTQICTLAVASLKLDITSITT